MNNIYVVTDYAGKGQRIGAFTSTKKLINYLKWWTDSAKLVFTTNTYFDDETNWIDLHYDSPKKYHHHLTFIKCIRDNEHHQERDHFEILIIKKNPEMDDDTK